MTNRGSSAKVTTDHDFIRRWVEERGGNPAAVKRTSRPGAPGIIRIDYPGYSGGASLQKISWDEFFQKFDDSNLAFLYQDKTMPSGEKSRFSKLVGRETVKARVERGERTNRRTLRGASSRSSSRAAGVKPAARRQPAAARGAGGRKAQTRAAGSAKRGATGGRATAKRATAKRATATAKRAPSRRGRRAA